MKGALTALAFTLSAPALAEYVAPDVRTDANVYTYTLPGDYINAQLRLLPPLHDYVEAQLFNDGGLVGLFPAVPLDAKGATTVAFGGVTFDALTITVYSHGRSIEAPLRIQDATFTEPYPVASAAMLAPVARTIVTPEPSAFVLLGLGLLVAVLFAGRRQ